MFRIESKKQQSRLEDDPSGKIPTWGWLAASSLILGGLLLASNLPAQATEEGNSKLTAMPEQVLIDSFQLVQNASQANEPREVGCNLPLASNQLITGDRVRNECKIMMNFLTGYTIASQNNRNFSKSELSEIINDVILPLTNTLIKNMHNDRINQIGGDIIVTFGQSKNHPLRVTVIKSPDKESVNIYVKENSKVIVQNQDVNTFPLLAATDSHSFANSQVTQPFNRYKFEPDY